MSQSFLTVIELARENVRNNPSLQGRSGEAVALQYLSGLKDEVKEVVTEIRPDNHVHLEDELSDIAWNYACVLAQLEHIGYIKNIEAVLEHSMQKYTQRAPAFLEESEEMWESIKATQKMILKKRHHEHYEN
jgi:NTP pyrophosphatase (non-canonical NTP hydrolase)